MSCREFTLNGWTVEPPTRIANALQVIGGIVPAIPHCCAKQQILKATCVISVAANFRRC